MTASCLLVRRMYASALWYLCDSTVLLGSESMLI